MASTTMLPMSQSKELLFAAGAGFHSRRRTDKQRSGLHGPRSAGMFGPLTRSQSGGVLPQLEEEARHFDGLAVIGRSAQRHTRRQIERAEHQWIVLQGIGQQIDLKVMVRSLPPGCRPVIDGHAEHAARDAGNAE